MTVWKNLRDKNNQKLKKIRDRWQLSCRVAKKSTAEKLSPNLLYNEEFSDGSVMSYFICQLDWTNDFQITGKNKKNNKTKEEENKQKNPLWMSQKETRIWVSTLSKEEPFWSVWGKQDEQKWWKRWFTVFKNYGFPLCLLLNIWVLVCHTFSNLRFVPVNFHQIL